MRGVGLDGATTAAGTEVNMEADVLWDLRFIFCTVPSASAGDKPILLMAGQQGLRVVLWGLFLTDIFPSSTSAAHSLF